jgi:crotonobetainyl-CoA:carnitine CoA-transferase CaiB-like acyl-CoA transferase
MADRPFVGVRVLDFTRVVSGPFATLVLADLGAEVIKIERPGVGDDTRSWAPPYVGDVSTYFAGLNRGKRSLVLDLASEADRERARRLALGADVLVENFRPGYMERIGLGYDALAEAHRRLIYCSITGYGRSGPYADRAAYDVTVSALGGMLSITGEPGGPPVKTGVPYLDLTTALYAFGGIAAALYERERTGRGRRVEVALLDVQVAQLSNAASSYLLSGEVMGRYGTAHPSIVPYQAFQAADGWVVIGALNDGMFQRLCGALEHPEWGSDPRFRTNPDRVAHRAELLRLLGDAIRQEPIDSWVARLAEAAVAVAPVNTVDRVFADPQVQASGVVQAYEDPRLGRLRAVATPIRLDGAYPQVARGVPALGGDAEEGWGEG